MKVVIKGAGRNVVTKSKWEAAKAVYQVERL